MDLITRIQITFGLAFLGGIFFTLSCQACVRWFKARFVITRRK